MGPLVRNRLRLSTMIANLLHIETNENIGVKSIEALKKSTLSIKHSLIQVVYFNSTSFLSLVMHGYT